MDGTHDGLLMHVSRRAMAGEFEVCFPADLYPQGVQTAMDALDVVEELESQLSFFRPDSEISNINRRAADGPVEVESWLFELLALAMRLYEESEGAYDITATPLWEAWGFAQRAGRVPAEEQLAEARRNVGSHLIELDAARSTIRFLRRGVRISLGSIGKGCALDRCAERLALSGMGDFLLHGDQSSVLAHGPAWQVGVRSPEPPERRLGVVRLCDRALGTSGIQFQSFRHECRRYGHLLDPRTGRPAEGVLSTTVLAPTATLADALSTALFVMGPQKALDYCRSHAEIGAIVVCPGSYNGDVEVRAAGLADDVWSFAAAKERVE
jgi:FAD:protein FMN transferase